jgi:lipoate-protein ligase A
MRYLDLTLPTPAENLALDEALLVEAEACGEPVETLRLWEPRSPMVVVGRSSKIAAEVRAETCRQEGIPVLRRTSGGAAVVTGPGCLMYALVLSLIRRPGLRVVDQAHRFVLRTLAEAFQPLMAGVQCRGISDLAIGERKVSGNSIRIKRDYLLYHGTLLYDFRLELIDRLLAMPPRQPAYRNGRAHEAFVANLPTTADALRQALRTAWQAVEPCDAWPRGGTEQLVAERYGRREWNER